MTDKIKSNITTSYMLFVNSFGDPYSLDKELLEKKMGCTVGDVFSSQTIHDRARSKLKKIGAREFNKAICLYLESFLTSNGINYARLADEVIKNPKFLQRALGTGNMNYLNLLIRILESIDYPKQGLLFGEVS